MTLIKSISGIRGTIGGGAGEGLNPLDIVKFTTAYVRFLGERKQGRLRIVVGRDARLSGEMVGDLIEGALLGCGAGLLPFAQTRFAQTVRSVAAAILTSLTGAPLTSPPAACLPSPEIQSERSQRIVR